MNRPQNNYNAQPVHPASQPGRHFIVRGLSILGASVLIFWSSGGFPPGVWGSLIRTYAQFQASGVGQRSVFVPLLAILIMQSLFVAAAWILLGWLAVRESTGLLKMMAEAKLKQAVSSNQPISPERGQRPLAIAPQRNTAPYNSQTPGKLQSNNPGAMPASQDFDDRQGSNSLVLPLDRKSLWSYQDEGLDNPFEWGPSPSPTPPLQQERDDYQTIDNSSKEINGIARISSSTSEDLWRSMHFSAEDQPGDFMQREKIAVNPFVLREEQGLASQRNSASMQSMLHTFKEEQSRANADAIQYSSQASYSAQESGQYPTLKDDGKFSSLLQQIGFLPDQDEAYQAPSDKAEASIQPEKWAKATPTGSSKTGVQASRSLNGRAEEDSTSLQANPFDVQKDVLAMFQQESSSVDPVHASRSSIPLSRPSPESVHDLRQGNSSIQARRGSKKHTEAEQSNEAPSQNSPADQIAQEPAPANDTPAQAYVFGNPFDGPLPDIFQQDEDLKQAIMAQNNSHHKASIASVQPVQAEEKKPAKRRRRSIKES